MVFFFVPWYVDERHFLCVSILFLTCVRASFRAPTLICYPPPPPFRSQKQQTNEGFPMIPSRHTYLDGFDRDLALLVLLHAEGLDRGFLLLHCSLQTRTGVYARHAASHPAAYNSTRWQHFRNREFCTVGKNGYCIIIDVCTQRMIPSHLA